MTEETETFNPEEKAKLKELRRKQARINRNRDRKHKFTPRKKAEAKDMEKLLKKEGWDTLTLSSKDGVEK